MKAEIKIADFGEFEIVFKPSDTIKLNEQKKQSIKEYFNQTLNDIFEKFE